MAGRSASAHPAAAAAAGGAGTPEFAYVRLPRYLSEDWGGWFSDLYLYSNGRSRRLTSTPRQIESSPRWSPDGRLLAFTRVPLSCNVRRKACRKTGPQSVWIMNADGSGLRRLTPRGRGPFSSPVWSPDGTELAVQGWGGSVFRPRPADGVYLIGADGRNLRRIARGQWQVVDWSPDGRYLLTRWRTFDIVTSQIPPHLLDLRTGAFQQTHATDGRRSQVWGDARFLPDGTRVVFTTGKGVFVASLDGRGRRLVTRVRDAGDVSLSADGNSVVFDTFNANVYVADMGTGTRRAVLASRDGESSPDWRPSS